MVVVVVISTMPIVRSTSGFVSPILWRWEGAMACCGGKGGGVGGWGVDGQSDVFKICSFDIFCGFLSLLVVLVLLCNEWRRCNGSWCFGVGCVLRSD